LKKTCGLAVLYEEDNMNKQIPNLVRTLFLLLDLYIHFIVVPWYPAPTVPGYHLCALYEINECDSTYAPLVTVPGNDATRASPAREGQFDFFQIDNIV